MKPKPKCCALVSKLHPMCISTTSLLKRMTIINILAMWYGPSVEVIKIYISRNFTYVCDQSRKALFNLRKKIKCLGSLPPTIMFYMFDALVCPILTYGSDVWGFNKSCSNILDKAFLNHVRCTLHVKGTICNDVVTGKSGKFPPSVYCHINVLCYYHRLLIMQDNRVVKSVFKALHNLNDYGFNTWITRLCELADHYKIDYDKAASLSPKQFKLGCAETVKNNFINRWISNINADQSTRMRTYASFKKDFIGERYLDLTPAVKHRIALTKLRTSSHNLEIERGRYRRPRVSPEQRLCSTCHVIDDEIHFVIKCRINACERKSFFQKMSVVDPNFTALDDKNKFVYLMQSQDQRTLKWLAKFLYNSFNIRNEIIYSSSWGIMCLVFDSILYISHRISAFPRDNGLAPNRWKAFTRTNDNVIYWHLRKPLGLDDLRIFDLFSLFLNTLSYFQCMEITSLRA